MSLKKPLKDTQPLRGYLCCANNYSQNLFECFSMQFHMKINNAPLKNYCYKYFN